MSRLQKVALEKHTATPGSMPKGERYEWTYTTSAPEQARSRAWRALKRDHPGENPACWREVDA